MTQWPKGELHQDATCQAADEPLLPILVEQVRAEDQFQTLVARLPSARRQHLIQQRHLLVTNTTDTDQGVFDQTQDLPERPIERNTPVSVCLNAVRHVNANTTTDVSCIVNLPGNSINWYWLHWSKWLKPVSEAVLAATVSIG